ncbi:MAG: preprotein translocase subunit SecE [Candidatus Omnitrophica bacterium]|nr:preprotein translocase subunit SecE [Candidatus Omnitrophota bacterium]MDE2214002.1 preprotein translocase subunit SecE [Candidatus Omnitrophota bacterium]
MVQSIQKFFSEVMAEMKKVSWCTRRELVDSTLIVIFSSFLLGLLIAVADVIFSRGVTLLIK